MSERFTITLEPTPEGPPAIVRLRLALKTLLRRHGLRAVDIRADIPHQTPQDARSEGGMARKASEGTKPASGLRKRRNTLFLR